jgi:hypothetical protein
MPSPEEKSHTGEESGPLELNKETLQNLDVEPAQADEVKGGFSYSGGVSQSFKAPLQIDPYSTGASK